ncbi:MAG: hypothetical protein NT117_03660 [Gammaproteobacteria bacterium]|nr:hypothetical protein [Gammaproteobacteria bacterium]
MQALFLVFLAAAWLNELVLAAGLARDRQARRAGLSMGLATGAVVSAAALLAWSGWPGSAAYALPSASRLQHFPIAFAFMCVLLQLASGRRQPALLGAAAHHWRVSLPLLSGNLAVLANASSLASPRPVATLAASLGLSVTLALLVPVAMALLDRLQVSQVPSSLRGTPIAMLCAASAALGLMGLARGLSW